MNTAHGAALPPRVVFAPRNLIVGVVDNVDGVGHEDNVISHRVWAAINIKNIFGHGLFLWRIHQ